MKRIAAAQEGPSPDVISFNCVMASCLQVAVAGLMILIIIVITIVIIAVIIKTIRRIISDSETELVASPKQAQGCFRPSGPCARGWAQPTQLL